MSSKKIANLSALEDMFSVWEGNVKDCSSGFSVLISSAYTYIVYADGKPTIISDTGGMIYPFSENPRKKPFIFKKSKIHIAKIVCIAPRFSFDVHWGTSDIMMMDPSTGKPCRMGASGTAYLEIEDEKRFADILIPRFQTAEDLRSWLKREICYMAGACMAEIVGQSEISVDNLGMLLPDNKMKLSNALYKNLAPAFSKYGIALSQISKNALIEHIMICNV